MAADVDVLREVLLPKFSEFGPVRKTANGFDVCCPVHGDTRPSLSIAYGTTHPVVMDCKAGCESEDILAKLGLSWEDLCKPRDGETAAVRGEWTPHGEAVAVYDYTDENGRLLFQVLRTADKQFPQRVPDATRKTGWRWTLGTTRRVLYRLPKVIEAVKDGQVIYVTEGEKDVHAIERTGFTATCNPGGAGKWREEYSEFLRDAVVIIIADKDKPGQAHARQVMASLKGVAAVAEINEAAGDLKDVSDHLAAGRTLADLEVTDRGEEYKPDLAPDLYEFIGTVDPPIDWIIPGLLEREDRLIWTGFEGQGKSVVIRQIAVAAAAGVHPFAKEEPITACRVLFIDCENPDRKSRRHFRQLEKIARNQGYPVPEGTLRILQKPMGIDLTREEDRAWLLERVTAHKPDLLVCGPFYRLHAEDANEEKVTRAIVNGLDAARLKVGCALITEHHAGHGEGHSRSVRPVGSSLLLRWPDLGLGVKPLAEADENGQSHHVAVVPWRGNREERHWPRELMWGTDKNFDWPWVVPTAAMKSKLTAIKGGKAGTS